MCSHYWARSIPQAALEWLFAHRLGLITTSQGMSIAPSTCLDGTGCHLFEAAGWSHISQFNLSYPLHAIASLKPMKKMYL